VLISNADLSLFRASATIDSSSYPQLVDDAMQSIAENTIRYNRCWIEKISLSSVLTYDYYIFITVPS
jgi:hypothetical protein